MRELWQTSSPAAPHLVADRVDLGDDAILWQMKVLGVMSWIISVVSILLLLGYNLYQFAQSYNWI